MAAPEEHADNPDRESQSERGWLSSLRAYLHPRVIGMFFLGFSAGLPFLLVFSTLQRWLAEEGYDPATVSAVSWLGITYSIKVFWAPVVDRVSIPFLTATLGRRRSWMVIAIVGIGIGLVGMAFSDPRTELGLLLAFGFVVAFSSATQDVALDAYRIEAVERSLQGYMAANYQFGYRVAVLVSFTGALRLAEVIDWSTTYLVMASLTLVGMATALIIQEPEVERDADAWRREERVMSFLARNQNMNPRLRAIYAWVIGAVVCPFVDFVARYGLQLALTILLFVTLYRLSDLTMASAAQKFYYDLGFTKSEVGDITKLYGLIMTLLGTFIGGLVVARFGVLKGLLIGGILVALTNLGFAVQAMVGHDILTLIAVISADNLSAGLAGTAFIAYLSSLTSPNYTATQYALFSSLMTLTGKVVAGFSGAIAESLGLKVTEGGKVLNPEAYANFFYYSGVTGLPAIALILYLLYIGHGRDTSRRPKPRSGNQAETA